MTDDIAPRGATPNASLLSRAAPPVGESAAPFAPWFKDPDKLLRQVVEHALADPQFAVRVVEEIGRLALKRPGIRKRLHMAASGGRRGAPGTSLAILRQVADTHTVAKSMGLSRAFVEAWIVDSALQAGPTTIKAAEKLLARALKAFPDKDPKAP